MTVHDFRSDTVTLPTPAMMAAVASAPLGDSARGDDPTVNALERRCAELTGKDDAVFVPSGTMANLAAVIAHDSRGGEVVVEATAHIYNSEGGGLSIVAGAVPRPLSGGPDGCFSPDALQAAIRSPADLAFAPTKLVAIENTHNAAGGRVIPLEHMAAIKRVAESAGLPVHLDGARLFNAAAFLGAPVAALAKHADTVTIALCKGLGAPVGAILAGDAAVMVKARRAAKLLGGAMRQAGLVAAAALVALEDPYPVHRRDHERAQRLARGIAAIDPSLCEADRVQTNIVNVFVDRFAKDAGAINAALRAKGILANSKGAKIRFVTHYQVDDASIDDAVARFGEVIADLRKAA